MTQTHPFQNEVARFAGELAESLSFNKSIGQIYGLLYVSPMPLSLDDISKQLKMSKGNASINLRTLESWEAVRPVGVDGSRRDHYEANRNIKEVALRRVQEGLARRLDMAERSLDSLLAYSGPGQDSMQKKRVQEFRALITRVRRTLKILPKVASFL